MINKITLSTIEKIIDINFELERSFMFVVDDVLAYFVAQYLEYRHGLRNEVFFNHKGDIDEYYISVLFNDSEPEIFYEQAKGNNGKYKYSDLSECVYYIYNETGMCEITAEKVLGGEGCVLFWFEIEMEDEDEYEDEDNYYGEYGEFKYCGGCGCDDCRNCDEADEEIDDSEEEEIRIIAEAIQNIYDVYPCPECVSDVVIKLASRFKDVGWCNHRDYIRAVNEDEED